MIRRLFRARTGAALLLSVTLVACSSGSRSSKGGMVASTSSAAPTTSTTTAPPPLPSPGGTTAALASAGVVQATLRLDHHAALRERNSLSDLVTSSAPGLGAKAFLVEDRGFVRVLDLSGATPRLERAIALQATALMPGQALGALSIQDERTALLTSSGTGAEAVWVFDPTAAQGPADVVRLDVGHLTVSWPAGTPNSAGADVGGRALPISYLSGAAIAGGRLWFTSSNFDRNFDLEPGTVFLYDWNPITRTASGAGGVIRTSAFNPTGLTRIVTPRGELLLVTCSGPFGTGPAAIDVIDPRGPAVVGRIDLGATNAAGRVVVSPDGTRGYVGDSSAGLVHVLDLAGIGDLIGQPGTADLAARRLGAWGLPAAGPSQYVSSIALSHTGRYLYAASFNESAVHVVDLAAPGVATIVRGFARTGDPANFEGLSSLVAVRPGVPGVDFQGPSLLVGTINISPTDQTIADVSIAIDAVELDRH